MIWAAGGFILLLISGIPIVLALGIAALVAIELTTHAPVSIVAQRIYGGVNSFSLMAIPFFVASGLLMEAGGIARRFVHLAAALVGWITGSLYLVSIVTGTGLAAISGSGSADTAAISSVMIPEMKKRGYDINLAAAVIAASGSLASIIPPSIVMIVIAITANASIGGMFLGGIVPGVLVMIGLMVGCWLFARRGGEVYQQDRQAFTFGALVRGFVEAAPGLLVPVVIIGGIVGGIFTATEAACVALFTTLVVSLFVYRELKFRDLPAIFLRAISLSATVLIIIATAAVFTWIIASTGFPALLKGWLTGLTSQPWVFLLIVNVLLLVVGMFMESISAILILLPILLPISNSFGIDPLHFGIVVALNLSIGLITPPYGICLYVASAVAGKRIEEVSTRIWLPLSCMVVVLVLVTYVPQVSLWLPSVLMH